MEDRGIAEVKAAQLEHQEALRWASSRSFEDELENYDSDSTASFSDEQRAQRRWGNAATNDGHNMARAPAHLQNEDEESPSSGSTPGTKSSDWFGCTKRISGVNNPIKAIDGDGDIEQNSFVRTKRAIADPSASAPLLQLSDGVAPPESTDRRRRRSQPELRRQGTSLQRPIRPGAFHTQLNGSARASTKGTLTPLAENTQRPEYCCSSSASISLSLESTDMNSLANNSSIEPAPCNRTGSLHIQLPTSQILTANVTSVNGGLGHSESQAEGLLKGVIDAKTRTIIYLLIALLVVGAGGLVVGVMNSSNRRKWPSPDAAPSLAPISRAPSISQTPSISQAPSQRSYLFDDFLRMCSTETHHTVLSISDKVKSRFAEVGRALEHVAPLIRTIDCTPESKAMLYIAVTTDIGDEVNLNVFALMFFYFVTGGENWKSSDTRGWHSASADYCGWYGVTCSDDRAREPTELKLRSNDVAGWLPSELFLLTNLREVDLSSNQLRGSIPSEVGLLKSLESLDLWDNQLEGQIPIAAVVNLPSLENLSLKDNRLSGTIGSELKQLTGLKVLELGGNSFQSGSIPSDLWSLTKLTLLELASLSFEGAFPTEIGYLTGLKFLNCVNNNFQSSLPSELGLLSSLEIVNLGLNKLSGPIPSEIGHLSELNFLHLANNKLSGFLPTEIVNLAALDLLDLRMNTFLEGSLQSLCDSRASFSAIVSSSSIECSCCLFSL